MKKFRSSFGKNVSLCALFFLCYSQLFASTNVSGPQSGSWNLVGSPYVFTGNVTVPTGQILTIDPGVEVQFTNSNGTVSQLIVQGTLKAQGNASNYINFTGGGFTFGSQRGPITFQSTSTNSILQYVNIDQLGYNGGDDRSAAIIVQSSSCTISNCNIKNISGTAMSIDTAITPTISNNLFTNNTNLDVILGLDNIRLLRGNNPLKIGLLTSTMSLNDTLTTDHLYYRLLANQTVALSKVLVINPGVWVQFTNSNGTVSQLIVQGTLKAQGNASNYINFTGGGFTFGSQRGPITFQSTSTNSILQYVNINQLGYNNTDDYSAAIIVNSSSCTISNCNIKNISGTAMSIANSVTPTISNNLFTDSVINNLKLDVILGLDNIRLLRGNNPLKIGLLASTMSLNDTLTTDHLYYRLLANQTVTLSKVLVINPGIEVQFPNSNGTTSQLIVEGTLKAQGNASNYINFTGGGFTFGSQRGPITFQSTSTNSILQYVNINQLGYNINNNSTPIVIIRSSSCQIINVIFQNNRGVAVQILNSASPTFLQSCFYSNISGAILSSGGSSKFRNCNFVGNNSGIVNTSASDIIDAASCWWGAASGPFQRITNPSGGGDSVSTRVTYTNFASQQFDCAADAGPLPVTLFDFKVSLADNSVNCIWQTTTELNTSHFVVERSSDGINFNEIGNVYATGNSNSTRSYRFTDNAPYGNTNYYRLKMVDKDGKYTYSKVVSINVKSNPSLVISPNPVKENLFTQIQSNSSQKVLVLITDIQGKVLFQETRNLQPGITSISYNTSILSKGMYLLVIKGDKIEVKTFVKE